MIVELFINNTIVDIGEKVSMPLNFNVADVREPDKRDKSYSKTIVLPATKANNILFTNVFEVNKTILNTSGQMNPDFNPNISVDASIYIDNLLQFKGKAQLLEIKMQGGTPIEYQIAILGTLANIFDAFGDLYLTDLDLSAYDHTWNRTNVKESWDTRIQKNGGNYDNFSETASTYFPNGAPNGEGYVYTRKEYNDLIDDNYTSFASDWFPDIYVKQYIDSMFSEAGYTYTSTFFNSQLFKNLVIPYNKKGLSGLQLTKTEYNESVSSAKKSTDLVHMAGVDYAAGTGTSPYTRPAGGVDEYNTSLADNIIHNSEFYDDGNNHDNSLGVFTCGRTGNYIIHVRLPFEVSVDCLTVSPTIIDYPYARYYQNNNTTPYNDYASLSSHGTSFDIGVYKNGVRIYYMGSNWINRYIVRFYRNWDTSDPNHKTFTERFSMRFSTQSIALSAGDTIEVRYKWNSFPVTVNDGTAIPTCYPSKVSLKYYGDSATLAGSANSLFYCDYNSTTLVEGDTMLMSRVIPANVKQKDFFANIIKMFNLYVEVDETNDKNLIIQTRNAFYSGGAPVDWTLKQDLTDWQIKPIPELLGNRYSFTYKEDKDYYNVLYKNTYSEIYGQYVKEIENEFKKGEKKFELMFSPTPVRKSSVNTTIMPVFLDVDGKQLDCNIRILYYGGLYPCQGWTFAWGAGDANKETLTSYPYVGHVDDPFNPTLDLCFETPLQIYWNCNVYTNNNLYNKYYSQFINEVTDKDSKLITANFLLTPLDIAKLNFRNLIYLDGSYYTLNKIIDYDITANELTKCELLKIKNYDIFSESNTPTPPFIDIFDIVQGGEDEVRDLAAEYSYSIIQGGEDEVRTLTPDNNIAIINGGIN